MTEGIGWVDSERGCDEVRGDGWIVRWLVSGRFIGNCDYLHLGHSSQFWLKHHLCTHWIQFYFDVFTLSSFPLEVRICRALLSSAGKFAFALKPSGNLFYLWEVKIFEKRINLIRSGLLCSSLNFPNLWQSLIDCSEICVSILEKTHNASVVSCSYRFDPLGASFIPYITMLNFLSPRLLALLLRGWNGCLWPNFLWFFCICVMYRLSVVWFSY